MAADIHIAGIIVHTTRPQVPFVRSHLSQVPRAIVHATAEDGRMVVTLETDSPKATLDYMDAIRALPGVFSVALVYQHAEPPEAMEEVIQ